MGEKMEFFPVFLLWKNGNTIKQPNGSSKTQKWNIRSKNLLMGLKADWIVQRKGWVNFIQVKKNWNKKKKVHIKRNQYDIYNCEIISNVIGVPVGEKVGHCPPPSPCPWARTGVGVWAVLSVWRRAGPELRQLSQSKFALRPELRWPENPQEAMSQCSPQAELLRGTVLVQARENPNSESLGK